jgi:GNAT superfamily N-acetyltransferase
MTELLVRDARATDSKALATLCTQLGYPAAVDVMPGRIARLTQDPNARALVAEDDGTVVGLASVHLRFMINHATPLAQLTLLVVDESVRGRGVGRALVDVVEAWAKQRGCKRIVVTTALDRKGAHAFYERLEFRHTGRRYLKDFSVSGESEGGIEQRNV